MKKKLTVTGNFVAMGRTPYHYADNISCSHFIAPFLKKTDFLWLSGVVQG